MNWSTLFERILPGCHIAVLSPLNYHRIACAIEDAGFAIRDCLVYFYGVNGSIGYLPIVLARKPPVGTVADNLLLNGCGALNIDACRIGVEARFNPPTHKKKTAALGSFENCFGTGTTVTGRWPANVIHDGSPEVLREFATYGERPVSGAALNGRPARANTARSGMTSFNAVKGNGILHADAGTADRFFACCTDQTALNDYLCRLIEVN